MSKIKNTNYFTVQGWMINDLGLGSNELLVYAIIYGFSQDECSEFTGSLNYLADFINSTKPTIIKCLKSLIDKGFIIKTDRILNRQNFPTYKAITFNFNRGKETLPPSKETLTGGGKETLPNNNTSIISNNIEGSSEPANSFKTKIFTKWSKEEFKASVQEARKKRAENPKQPNFTKEMLNDFFRYWIAPHKSSKMFFATQDKWDTLQRLISWQSKDNKK